MSGNMMLGVWDPVYAQFCSMSIANAMKSSVSWMQFDPDCSLKDLNHFNAEWSVGGGSKRGVCVGLRHISRCYHEHPIW
jgi:hypothetical protein